MAGNVVFDSFDTKGWNVSNGIYEIILGTAYEIYLDKTRAPTFAKYCRDAFGPFLHESWPDHYADEPSKTYYVLAMDKNIPRAEQYAIIEALEKLATAFDSDTVDPRVSWNRAKRQEFVNWTRDLISLMRRSLAISETD
jgi:hypothetical protein